MSLVVRPFPVNRPQPSRLDSRHVQNLRFVGGGAGLGRVRVRSRTVGTIIARGAGHGRVRLRSKYFSFTPGSAVLVLTGRVYVAPVGTPGPASVTSSLDAAFQDLGFLSEDGVTFSESQEVRKKSSWTSLYPKELKIVERRATVSFVLQEFNKRAVEFATGGAISTNATQWKKLPGSEGVSRALVVDMVDGQQLLRIYFPSGIVESSADSTFSRGGVANLPVRYGSVQTTDPPYTIFRTDSIDDEG